MASSGKSPGMLMRNAGIFNPILVQAVGLCPVVAMATSVKSAALLAAVAAVIITFSEFFASLLLKRVPRWVRIGIYIILGGAIVAPLMILIERTNAPLFGSLGIYLPIMAVNSLNVLRCERFAVKISPFSALLDGLTASVGYSSVLILTGLVREVFGSGSIFGHKFFEGRTMTGLLLPFGGFIVLGFAGAILRVLIAKFWPKYLDKKQPKPGSKKKYDKKAKPVHEHNIRAAISTDEIPEIVADETTFDLDEIEEKSEEPTESASDAETSSELTEKVTEQVTTESAIVESEADTCEEIAEEHESEEKEPKETPVPFKELTINDIESEIDTGKHNYSENSADDDTELEKLMNRSIGDILDKHEKEDDKE